MVDIILTNGDVRSFTENIDGFALAKSISSSLAKKAIAIKVDGAQKDLSTLLDKDCKVEIITTDSEEGLEILRHDAAHILAQAVEDLYPDAQVTIGPTIENGFYYDFAKKEPFNESDLIKIEKRMKEIIFKDYKIERRVYSRNNAIKHFQEMGQHYKVEIIKDIPEDEEVSIYHQGDFSDLCRGPHSPSTGMVKAVKLMKVSGSYWRGDSKREALQRIYGTAWVKESQLQEYLEMLKEAERRDHRKLGKEMDLFHFQEDAPGAVFWHYKGHRLFHSLMNYMRQVQDKNGYLEISTPEIMDRSLWEKSGHWEKFGENMFTAYAGDDKVYAVRPMNCPGGVQVFNQGIKSYRDLPLRLSEFGKVHRYEPSGSLHGLMRVRAFTQDDAHIFCTEEQIKEESLSVCKLVLSIYKDFGFEDVKVKFSDRPEKRIGDDSVWDKSEKALLEALKALGVEYTINPGEGAFYGPKLEFVLKDSIGRSWQLGTLQVDLNLPVRLGAYYTGADGKKHHPVMLHRALFGSLERFTGILIEHYGGHLPLWISPVQVVVMSITSDVESYAKSVNEALTKSGIRSILDIENETLNYKIKQHSISKIPLIVIVGRKEEKENVLSVRSLGSSQQTSYSLDGFIKMIKEKSKNS